LKKPRIEFDNQAFLNMEEAIAELIHALTPLLSNLAVSTTNTVNLMFNSIKMAKATN
jgi:hypothetical protein